MGLLLGHEIEGCGDKEGRDAPIGSVVVVERSHHTVECLQVAEVAHSLGGGNQYNDSQSSRIAPEELSDADRIAEYLCRSEEERNHKPQSSQQVFERHPRQLRCATADKHPRQGDDDCKADRMTQNACVVGVIDEDAEKEDDGEKNHHRFNWHG